MTQIHSRRAATALLALTIGGLLAACSGTAGGDTTTSQPPPTTETPGEPALPDGEYLAFVTVGKDETGEIVLGVDVAEMLTGEEARQAAVDAGVIGEGEDLPNDFFINNPEVVLELVSLAPDAEITVISGTDTSQQVAIDAQRLLALYEGTDTGEPVYGIVAGQPIVMDLVIEGGVVTEAHAVYLP
jgi:hypothetical protein